jgi:hypothetical protein
MQRLARFVVQHPRAVLAGCPVALAPPRRAPFSSIAWRSAEVIAHADPMLNMGGDPAIPGVYTIDLTQGIPQSSTDVLWFTAPPTGSSRIFRGVSGHGLSGMWSRFRVDPAAKTPGLVTG